MANRWDIAYHKMKTNTRITLNEYICFMIGYGYCSTAYYDFMDFIKKNKHNHPRFYRDWELLRKDWHTVRVLDQYRYNV